MRNDPYGRFNFMVKLGDTGGEDQVAGGFSEVSGLESEIVYAEYRNGNEASQPRPEDPDPAQDRRRDAQAWPHRRPAPLRVAQATREGTIDRRTVTITLLDETRAPVCQWRLRGAQPRKWTAPALSAKGKDVAIEELVLIGEQLEFTSL